MSKTFVGEHCPDFRRSHAHDRVSASGALVSGLLGCAVRRGAAPRSRLVADLVPGSRRPARAAPPPDGILSSDDPVRVTVSPDGLLLAERGPAFTLAVAMGSSPVPLPPGTLLLASAPLAPNGQLPPDTAAWLHRA